MLLRSIQYMEPDEFGCFLNDGWVWNPDLNFPKGGDVWISGFGTDAFFLLIELLQDACTKRQNMSTTQTQMWALLRLVQYLNPFYELYMLTESVLYCITSSSLPKISPPWSAQQGWLDQKKSCHSVGFYQPWFAKFFHDSLACIHGACDFKVVSHPNTSNT